MNRLRSREPRGRTLTILTIPAILTRCGMGHHRAAAGTLVATGNVTDEGFLDAQGVAHIQLLFYLGAGGNGIRFPPVNVNMSPGQRIDPLGGTTGFTQVISAVPEPSSCTMAVLGGLMAAGYIANRRRYRKLPATIVAAKIPPS